MGKQAQDWAFLSMGLNVAATQGLLIRLLLVSFSGNELSIGLILGSWMLAEALGSHLAGRRAHQLKDRFGAFVLLQMAFAAGLPLVVAAGYMVRSVAGLAPGEAMGLAAIVWTSLPLLAPLSAIHGAMFSLGCAAFAAETPERGAVGQPYIREALGAMCGGALLTFAFARYLNPLQAALILALLGWATVLYLLHAVPHVRRSPWMAIAGMASAVCLYLLLSPQTLAIHRSLIQLRWQEAYDVIYDQDSPYGNVAVTQLRGQYTFLVNGTPILTTPFPDVATVEDLVHLPMLFHPRARRVLVVGGGLGGVLSEFLKYPLERVDYAELDPLLISAVRAHPTELTRSELEDPRVHVQSVDGRHLLNLKQSDQGAAVSRYDVVLVFTLEFLQTVRRVLDDQGLLAISAPGSLTYLGAGMRDLNLMIQDGLQVAFGHVRPIPGETTLWLASPSLALAAISPEELAAAWQMRAITARVVSPAYLKLRLDPLRQAWFETALQTGGPVGHNQDLRPVGVLYGLAYWSEIFAPATHGPLTHISGVALWQWCLLIILLTLVAMVARRVHRGWERVTLPAAVATTGFAGMVCDLTVVFVFQTLYGYVYSRIGLVIAAFMGGLALGGWLAMRKAVLASPAQRTLLRSELVLITYWACLPLLLLALGSTRAPVLVQVALLCVNTLGGCLAGFQFPLVSRLYRRSSGETGRAAGTLYAADLVGGFLGASLVGIALLPVLGTTGTCLVVLTGKVCSLILLITARDISAPDEHAAHSIPGV